MSKSITIEISFRMTVEVETEEEAVQIGFEEGSRMEYASVEPSTYWTTDVISVEEIEG